MVANQTRFMDSDELRRQAEAVVRNKMDRAMGPLDAPQDLQRMLHDLRVHQIELEIQNEELRRAQVELDAARERYFKFYDLAPVGFATISEKGLILEVNLTTAILLGLDRASLVRQPFTRFIHDEDQDIYYQHRRKLFETGEPQACELRMVRMDRTVFWTSLQTTVARDAVDAFVLRVVISDITSRKRTEAEHERLMSAIEQSHEAVVITDTRGSIQYVNPAFEEITGYLRQEVIGQTPRILNSGVQDRSFYRDLWGSISSGKTWCGRMVNRKKDGTLFTEDASISPVRDGKGSIINYVGVKRDITKEIVMEKRAAQSQRIEAIGALAGGIAHDFNNILCPITGMAEILLEDLPAGSGERENVREILMAARRAAELVKQILTFSRQGELKKTPVRIQQILKEVLKLTRATIPANIEVRSEIRPDCGLVLADPTQMHQVAMNLITNAYHAVEDAGGIISIGLKESELGEDAVAGALAAGKYAVLTVSDTGSGIDPSIIARIFEPYFTTKPQGKGTGLGLSVVYGIVKEYGGDIRVASEPGKGAVFSIFLPLMDSVPDVVLPETVDAHSTGHERILLVDDEETIVGFETRLLERLGYEVTAHTGSMEALETFKANPERFDVVITDMAMPHMTGIQLADALTAIRADIPIILCTGFSEKISAESVKGLGIQGFLMKPIKKSDLAHTIRKVLDERRLPLTADAKGNCNIRPNKQRSKIRRSHV